MLKSDNEFVALIPAAGTGSRLGDLPFSKELLPLCPAVDDPFTASPGSRVAIEDSLHLLKENGVREAHVVIAPAKKDIPAFLEQQRPRGIDVIFHSCESSPSVPHTLCTAISHLRDRNVVLIFPDIVFRPRNVVAQTILKHRALGADVTLGLVPSDRGDKVDIVTAAPDGKVLTIAPKPGAGITGWTWITATWSDRFSEFLLDYTHGRNRTESKELYVGDVFNAAIHCGLIIATVPIPDGVALDIGTPDDLKFLWQGDFVRNEETS